MINEDMIHSIIFMGDGMMIPENIYLNLFKELPNTLNLIHEQIEYKDFYKFQKETLKLDEKDILIKSTRFEWNKKKKENNEKEEYLMFLFEEYCIVYIHFTFNKTTIFYSKDETKERCLQQLKSCLTLERTKVLPKNTLYMIRSSWGKLELVSFQIKKQKLNIEENYNDDFLPVHQKILTFLNERSKSGLVLLHGSPGTGKTSYLRYLMSISRKKMIVSDSRFMSAITDPGFIGFVMEQKESIIILEDCENLLLSRETQSANSLALANLLNLTDGLLSDAFRLKIICTFNVDIRRIDKALLRKGRLIVGYKFRELCQPKASRLAEKLGITQPIEKDTTLADLYRYMDEDSQSMFGKKGAIGFNADNTR